MKMSFFTHGKMYDNIIDVFSVRSIIYLFMILFFDINRCFLLVATAVEDVATAHYEDVEGITSLQPPASEPTLSHQKLLRNAVIK